MHRLKPGVKSNGMYCRDVFLRHMLLSDILAASGSVFSFFSCTVPHHIAPKTRYAAGSRDARFYPTRSVDDRSTWRALRPIAGYAQQWVSEWVLWPPILTGPQQPAVDYSDYTAWSVLQESIVPRSTETTHQQRVNRSVTHSHGYWMCCWPVASASTGAFVLEAGILSTRCNKDDVMWHVWLFQWQ